MTASASQPGPARNLLDIPWVRAFLKSPLYPGIFAYPVLVVFGYIVYALLWGPTAASANVGTSLTWVLWWPLIPIAMFTLGRFWCAICPFGTLIDVIGKAVGLGRPVPGFLKRYGIWIIDATFILITWADHVFGVVENPRGSGYLLGAMATAAVVTAAPHLVPVPVLPGRPERQLLPGLHGGTARHAGHLRHLHHAVVLQGLGRRARLPGLRVPAHDADQCQLQLLRELRQELPERLHPHLGASPHARVVVHDQAEVRGELPGGRDRRDRDRAERDHDRLVGRGEIGRAHV